MRKHIFPVVDQIFEDANQKRNTLYDKMVALNIPIDNHESDLLVPVTSETTEVVRTYQFSNLVKKFQFKGEPWYEIPFAFQPYWDAKAGVTK